MVKSERVIEWLTELLVWCSKDPMSRWKETVKEIYDKREFIAKALEDAVRPELKDYVDKIKVLLTPIGGE